MTGNTICTITFVLAVFLAGTGAASNDMLALSVGCGIACIQGFRIVLNERNGRA